MNGPPKRKRAPAPKAPASCAIPHSTNSAAWNRRLLPSNTPSHERDAGGYLAPRRIACNLAWFALQTMRGGNVHR
jgi:hypothetical protein